MFPPMFLPNDINSTYIETSHCIAAITRSYLTTRPAASASPKIIMTCYTYLVSWKLLQINKEVSDKI